VNKLEIQKAFEALMKYAFLLEKRTLEKRTYYICG
jgi:hypothetical protein